MTHNNTQINKLQFISGNESVDYEVNTTDQYFEIQDQNVTEFMKRFDNVFVKVFAPDTNYSVSIRVKNLHYELVHQSSLIVGGTLTCVLLIATSI